MKTIRLCNIKSLGDTGNVEIKPITLLVGKNGSGKSSFLRFFPLLRQSVEARIRGPLLWYGRYIDFGDFEAVLNNSAVKREMEFEFSFEIPKQNTSKRYSPYQDGRRLRMIESSIEDFRGQDIWVKSSISSDKDGNTYVSGVTLKIGEDQIDISVDHSNEVTEFKVNQTNITKECGNIFSISSSRLVPNLFMASTRDPKDIRKINDDFYKYIYYWHYKRMNPLWDKIRHTLRPLFHGATSSRTIDLLIDRLHYSNEAVFLDQLQHVKIGGAVWRRRVSALSSKDPIIIKVRNLLIAVSALRLLNYSDDHIAKITRNISYMAPVRAYVMRYYREQELAVDEVDAEGKNLAVFIRSLSRDESARFRQWTTETFGFEAKAKKTGSHISLTLKEEDGSCDYNLADVGFGYSQILPIIAQLWSIIESGKKETIDVPIIITIEQPELHLHPDYQARIADMFVSVIKLSKECGLDFRLIIETHSATVINRIGNKIAKKGFDFQDVNVVLFEKAGPDKLTNVRSAFYNKDGYLENWPYGFFEPEDG